jgi:hypothetical protein
MGRGGGKLVAKTIKDAEIAAKSKSKLFEVSLPPTDPTPLDSCTLRLAKLSKAQALHLAKIF